MIKRKDFDNGNFKRISNPGTEEHPVAQFLKKHTRSSAFTAKEIAKNIKMMENTVRGMLSKLIKDGLVVHKSPYYAWKKK